MKISETCALCPELIELKEPLEAQTVSGKPICQECSDMLCRGCGERLGEVEAPDGTFLCTECHSARNERFYDMERDKDWS